ncbi:hypothetical protein [Spiroplasma endosymbiont of Agriotes lineatus]|uniref:hypothetical protein n=1 Tax=Spiroplasma endosymbiont of Agriotes lineatus TaxID=3077930 RepID=UPI0030D592B6
MNIKSDDINDFYAKENLLQDNNIKPLIKENEEFSIFGSCKPVTKYYTSNNGTYAVN